MTQRSSPYRRDIIIKLMEAAGWEAREGTKGHIVLNKEGKRSLALTDPVHKNGIAEVQRELGLHILQVIPRSKGNRPSRAELLKRVILAKQMLDAGFKSSYVLNKAGLSALQRVMGPIVKDLRELSPEQIVDKFYRTRMKEKGVIVRPTIPPN